MPAPIIALVEASVWGGACETLFACDLTIATTEATLAATPAKLSVPYNSRDYVEGIRAFKEKRTPVYRGE